MMSADHPGKSTKMLAARLSRPGDRLSVVEVEIPRAEEKQLLVEVRACGVCRTDLHVLDGELNKPKLPLIPGHEIVGRVIETGSANSRFHVGQRIGIPWLGGVCGHCLYCRTGQENLCDEPSFTGYTIDGGYAEYAVANEDFCFPLPEAYDDLSAAPLLCAGLIGYRSLVKAGDAARLGIYGFGAAAHIICQVAVFQERKVFALTRPGDTAAQKFARSLGAVWAGDSHETPPEELDAAILFAPVGALVPAALRSVRKGGTVVCAGIHMSDIPSFPYDLLWGERQVRSVANLTRQDAAEFLRMAPQIPVRTQPVPYPLSQANDALEALRNGAVQGAAVLVPDRFYRGGQTT